MNNQAVATTGLALSREYYERVVGPLLVGRWPGLRHAAARLGSGSDVLGLDDEMSRDHDWGLRLTILLERDQVEPAAALLDDRLPDTFHGLPTRFATTWDPAVRPRVEVDTAEHFVWSRLGLHVSRHWDAVDWLSVTGQSVLEITAGEIFADSLGVISDVRRRLTWYPDDVWRYVLASDWQRMSQLLPSVGRTGSRGDDVGSRVITSQVAVIAMHLGFLLQRQWPPYAKWRGTWFQTLPVADEVQPHLRRALASTSWSKRQSALAAALTTLLECQRSRGLPTARGAAAPFWDRPFIGVPDEVSRLLISDVTDPLVRRLPSGVGSIEQWIDNVDVLKDPGRRMAVVHALRLSLIDQKA